jgi:sterol desaturase/sphingolipid hydroxylase (fatty acid hydroxylase superfamily)
MLLLGIMDLGMYLAHRVAHHRWIFRWVHAIHHTHESVNPISLFVLHPGEVVGFGALLIVVLMSASWSGAAVLAYLGINFLFGTLGHSGVEPFPACWARIPVLREIGSSTFHANHHRFPTRNFGFYTAIWDRIFRTGGK